MPESMTILTDDEHEALLGVYAVEGKTWADLLPVIETVVKRHEEAALRAHADRVGDALKAELLVEFGRQIDDYEAKALPALAERIRENADAFARFAADKKAAVQLVALLIEHAGRDVVTRPAVEGGGA